MKILVIQTAFLGDVILTTPLIRKIKEFFPNAEIDIVTTPEGSEILKNNPAISEIIVYDKHRTESSWGALFAKGMKLRKKKYDMAFLPHRSFRTGLLAFLSGTKERIGFGGSPSSIFLTRRIKRDLSIHEIQRNLALLEPFFGKVEPIPPDVYPSKDDFIAVREKLKDIITEQFGWKVIFAPGSIWPTKRYPRVYYAEVGKILLDSGVKYIILVGGKEDRQICDDIKEKIGKRAINVAGLLTPLQTCALMTMCSLLISNDSAPLHMASALGLPTVGIYGPTTPLFGFGPYGKLVRVMEVELECRPCSPHGPRVCPLGHHMCMRNISPHDVADAALDMLVKRFWLLRTNPEIFRFPMKID